MKNLGIVITDRVGYRNFILSNFISEAKDKFDEVIILSSLPAKVYYHLNLAVKVIELPVFEENFLTWFFRKAKEISHLRLNRRGNFGIDDNYKLNHSKSKSIRGYTTRFIYLFNNVFHNEKHAKWYGKRQNFCFKNNYITKVSINLLDEIKPNHLIFTHKRASFIAPLAYAAKVLNIITSAFIFSWDNLASKCRMAACFDFYLVWSDLMKSELLQLYSTLQQNQIKVVGTPQFEPYVKDKYKSNKVDFFNKFCLDINLRTICFSFGNISTIKNDELYIETILSAILNNEINNVNLIIRTFPAEDPIRFETFRSKFPFIKWNYPKWVLSRENHQEEWSQRITSIEDFKDLRGLSEFSDLNMNMLSKMRLDFIQFGKPVINTVFGNSKYGLFDD